MEEEYPRNAMKEAFDLVDIFGQTMMLGFFRVNRETVPEGWFCYDLRGSEEYPGEPAILAPFEGVYHVGTVLSPEPIWINKKKGFRMINGELSYHCRYITITEFCKDYGLKTPQVQQTSMPRLALPDEAGPSDAMLQDEQKAQETQKNENTMEMEGKQKDMEKTFLEFLRTQFPVGSRIKLTAMGSDPRPLAPGSVGTLKAIDDIGTFHIEWDNGRSLGLVPGEDQFKVLPPETTLLKLYMPLMGCLYERDRYGDLEEEPQELTGKDLWRYEDAVNGVILKNRAPEEAESGIMHWYGEDDEVNRKVRRVEFVVEERQRQLWGVAECHITESLTFEELCVLKRFVTGQASDAWGEGLEQRPIYLEDDAELYIHLWQSNGYFIRTEEEQFVTGIQQCADGLPELCFSVLSNTGKLICIKRGESGYYPSDWNTEDAQENRELADICNAKLGVSMAQRLAMETGSMHGWHVPGANPKAYEALEKKEEMQCQTM